MCLTLTVARTELARLQSHLRLKQTLFIPPLKRKLSLRHLEILTALRVIANHKRQNEQALILGKAVITLCND